MGRDAGVRGFAGGRKGVSALYVQIPGKPVYMRRHCLESEHAAKIAVRRREHDKTGESTSRPLSQGMLGALLSHPGEHAARSGGGHLSAIAAARAPLPPPYRTDKKVN